MKKFLYFLLIIFLVLSGGAWYIFNSLLSPENAKSLITKDLSAKLGRKISLESIEISFFNGISANKFVLSGNPAFDDYDQIKAEKLYLKPNYLALFAKTLLFDSVILENPQITIQKDIKGNFDFQDITGIKKDIPKEKKGTGMTIAAASFHIKNGSLTFIDAAPSLEAFINAGVDTDVDNAKKGPGANSPSGPLKNKITPFSGIMENINISGHLNKNLTMSVQGSASIKNGAEKLKFNIPLIAMTSKGTVLNGSFDINKLSAIFLKPYIDPSYPIDLKSGKADIKGTFNINPKTGTRDISVNVAGSGVSFNHVSLPLPIDNLDFDASITPEKAVLNSMSTSFLTIPVYGSGVFVLKNDPSFNAIIEIKKFNPGSLKTTLSILAGKGGPLFNTVPPYFISMLSKGLLTGNLSLKINSEGKFKDPVSTGKLKVQTLFIPSEYSGTLSLDINSSIKNILNLKKLKTWPKDMNVHLMLKKMDLSVLIPYLPENIITQWNPKASGTLTAIASITADNIKKELFTGRIDFDKAGFTSQKFNLPISLQGSLAIIDSNIKSESLKALVGENVINTGLEIDLAKDSSSIFPFTFDKPRDSKINISFNAPDINLADMGKAGLLPPFIDTEGKISISKGKLQGSLANLQGGTVIDIKDAQIKVFSMDKQGVRLSTAPIVIPVTSFNAPLKIVKSLLTIDSAQGLVCSDSSVPNVKVTDLSADILNDPGNFKAKINWQDINIEKLISANPAVQHILKGKSKGSLEVKGTISGGISSLNGSSEADIQKGEWEIIGKMSTALKGLQSISGEGNILGSVPGADKIVKELNRLIPDFSKIAFTEIKNTKPVTIKEGVISCDEILVVTPEKNYSAKGTVNLTTPETTFDVTIDVGMLDLTGKISGKTGSLIDALSPEQKSIPLRAGAKGTFASPSFSWADNIDKSINNILKNALKAEGKNKLDKLTGGLLNKFLKPGGSTQSQKDSGTAGVSAAPNDNQDQGTLPATPADPADPTALPQGQPSDNPPASPQNQIKDKVNEKIQNGVNKFLKKLF